MKFENIPIVKKALRFERYFPYLICFLFFLAYSILSIIKHNHFLSGYDLAVSDQAIWLMSKFKNPISTPHAYANTSLFTDHVEVIYALISPIYWFLNDVRILIIIQAFIICLSGIPIYLLAKQKKIKTTVIYAILISFLMFYGIQNAIWADVHSLVFAASFMPWFIYFLYKSMNKLTLLFFFLMILCKEDIALLTFMISFVFYILERKKIAILLMVFSIVYLFMIFFIYFPFLTQDGYRFQNKDGLLSSIDIANMYNTSAKRDVLFYSIGWFGFLPLLSPLHILIVLADLAHYFVLGSNYVTSAQGMFLHYRVTLAALLAWSSILVISKYKKLNKFYCAVYILLIALVMQYVLHLPLSYLVKGWFWKESSGAKNIRSVIQFLPADASVVSQVNITPHINHRPQIFTLWPEKKTFKNNSPCGVPSCDWFRWAGNPEYLLVDTSPEWDTRHLLINNEEFRMGVNNMESAGIVKIVKKVDSSVLYRIIKSPKNI